MTLNFNWNEQAYWYHYEWDFPQHVGKWYVEETLYVGPFALSGGVKQFLVGVSREDRFSVDPAIESPWRSIPIRVCSSPAASPTRRRSRA